MERVRDLVKGLERRSQDVQPRHVLVALDGAQGVGEVAMPRGVRWPLRF